MTPKTWIGETLFALQNEKGNICVSVIIPTHSASLDRRTYQLNIKKAIEKAEQLMKMKCSDSVVSSLTKKLHELFVQINFDRNANGVGLFVSSHIQLLVSFPFPVEEKIIVGDSFEVRDVLYKLNYSDPYYLLLVTDQEIRLFLGSMDALEEIKNKHFPIKYEDEYIYSPPSRSTSYAGQAHVKSFEKDKSTLEVIRHSNFFRQVDTILDKYLQKNEPILLSGTEKALALYENVSRHQKNFAGKIPGNYSHLNLQELTGLVLPVIFEYHQNKRTQLIEEFIEKTGRHRGITGIRDIWSAAMQGKAHILLVEKDFRCPGFLNGTKNLLYLEPLQKPCTVLADAVDDLIELVLEKKGHVFFVDNDLLKDYGRIALITRY